MSGTNNVQWVVDPRNNSVFPMSAVGRPPQTPYGSGPGSFRELMEELARQEAAGAGFRHRQTMEDDVRGLQAALSRECEARVKAEAERDRALTAAESPGSIFQMMRADRDAWRDLWWRGKNVLVELKNDLERERAKSKTVKVMPPAGVSLWMFAAAVAAAFMSGAGVVFFVLERL